MKNIYKLLSLLALAPAASVAYTTDVSTLHHKSVWYNERSNDHKIKFYKTANGVLNVVKISAKNDSKFLYKLRNVTILKPEEFVAEVNKNIECTQDNLPRVEGVPKCSTYYEFKNKIIEIRLNYVVKGKIDRSLEEPKSKNTDEYLTLGICKKTNDSAVADHLCIENIGQESKPSSFN